MPSPFSGMDPFLEGYLWVDVHQRLANQISAQLAPLISPRYVSRLAVSVLEDETGEVEINVMYPDVEIIEPNRKRMPRVVRETAVALLPTPVLEATPSIVVRTNLKYRQVSVEIRDAGKNELVTSIEILLPVNKRVPGFAKYWAKRQRLYEAGVHLLEIDLLRRGTRVFTHDEFAQAPYLVALTRAFGSKTRAWPTHLQDKLPTVIVPLRAQDPDILLDLQAAFTTIYDVARYDLTIDYAAKPPPPELSTRDAKWMRELLHATKTRQR